MACFIAVAYLYSSGMGEQPLVFPFVFTDLSTLCSLACLSSIACCCGDTWASEIGSVLGKSPRLITTFRSVPRGTNGGVSLAGLAASSAGGAFIGLVYYITSLIFLWSAELQWVALPVGLCAGLFGSVLDSVMGATLQYSGYDHQSGRITHSPGADVKHIAGWDIISNNTVNLLSSLITAISIPVAVVFFS